MTESFTQVNKGSSGGYVKKLQKLLNQEGYGLAEDGVFGDKTLTAVKDYQLKNGLKVDGIVGKNTWGSLTNTPANDNKSASNNKSTASKGFTYDDFSYDGYKASDTVTQAMAALNTQLSAKPGEYQSSWKGQIDSIINQILNREDFSYDLNSDALYQQYKDQYTQQGKLAMMDTMGQAAALTGGYGSSYATTAGNQAYQSYLSQLNEVVPELYSMALDKYNQDGEELYNNYALLSDQESQDYSRYQDSYNKWLTELQYYYDQYNTERNFDYNQYATERDFDYGVYSDDKSYAYNDYLNKIEQERWQAEYDESVRQFNANYNLSKKQYEDAKKTSQTTGDSTAALDHVASMSSYDLVETMQGYNADEDNTGLAAFLDDCVASNRLTEAQADEYYSKYRTGGSTTITDTTVKKNATSKKPAYGGAGGKFHYILE